MSSSETVTPFDEQLKEAGNKLLQPPSDVDELLSLLDKIERSLCKVDQSPAHSTLTALSSMINALIAEDLFKHQDIDVKVSVASCISELTRITAPEAPYDDDKMKDVFQLIVLALEQLSDKSSRSFNKRVSILETVARIRSCVVMLDLECDGLILEMFRNFLNSIRDYHQEKIFTCMGTIMSLVLDESEDISIELLNTLLCVVKKDNQEVSPSARRLVENVFKKSADKLIPYLRRAIKSMNISLDDYDSNILTSLAEGTSGHNHNNNNNNSSREQLESKTEVDPALNRSPDLTKSKEIMEEKKEETSVEVECVEKEDKTSMDEVEVEVEPPKTGVNDSDVSCVDAKEEIGNESPEKEVEKPLEEEIVASHEVITVSTVSPDTTNKEEITSKNGDGDVEAKAEEQVGMEMDEDKDDSSVKKKDDGPHEGASVASPLANGSPLSLPGNKDESSPKKIEEEAQEVVVTEMESKAKPRRLTVKIANRENTSNKDKVDDDTSNINADVLTSESQMQPEPVIVNEADAKKEAEVKSVDEKEEDKAHHVEANSESLSPTKANSNSNQNTPTEKVIQEEIPCPETETETESKLEAETDAEPPKAASHEIANKEIVTGGTTSDTEGKTQEHSPMKMDAQVNDQDVSSVKKHEEEEKEKDTKDSGAHEEEKEAKESVIQEEVPSLEVVTTKAPEQTKDDSEAKHADAKLASPSQSKDIPNESSKKKEKEKEKEKESLIEEVVPSLEVITDKPSEKTSDDSEAKAQKKEDTKVASSESPKKNESLVPCPQVRTKKASKRTNDSEPKPPLKNLAEESSVIVSNKANEKTSDSSEAKPHKRSVKFFFSPDTSTNKDKKIDTSVEDKDKDTKKKEDDGSDKAKKHKCEDNSDNNSEGSSANESPPPIKRTKKKQTPITQKSSSSSQKRTDRKPSRKTTIIKEKTPSKTDDDEVASSDTEPKPQKHSGGIKNIAKLNQEDKSSSKKKADIKEAVSSPKSRTKSIIKDEDEIRTKRKRTPSKEKKRVKTENMRYGENLVNAMIKVWWPADEMYYVGHIESFDSIKRKHKVSYTDGDIEILNLRKEKWDFVNDDSSLDLEPEADPATNDSSSDIQKNKKAKKSSNLSEEVTPKRGSSSSSSKGKGGSSKSGKKSKDGDKVDPPKSGGGTSESDSESSDDELGKKFKSVYQRTSKLVGKFKGKSTTPKTGGANKSKNKSSQSGGSKGKSSSAKGKDSSEDSSEKEEKLKDMVKISEGAKRKLSEERDSAKGSSKKRKSNA